MDFDAKDFISTMVHGINFQSKFGGIAKIFVLWFNADTSKATVQQMT
ncbi:MAG: hypothetical protein KH240_09030 [Faecalibacterium prausnitzii]|jgi:hypothetical protein|nr:hypothetical protein [Faecalibacterium prausnitzii]